MQNEVSENSVLDETNGKDGEIPREFYQLKFSSPIKCFLDRGIFP